MTQGEWVKMEFFLDDVICERPLRVEFSFSAATSQINAHSNASVPNNETKVCGP